MAHQGVIVIDPSDVEDSGTENPQTEQEKARLAQVRELIYYFVRKQFYVFAKQNKERWRCKHCRIEQTYDSKRALEHLARACPGIPPDTREEATNLMDQASPATNASTRRNKRKAEDMNSDSDDDTLTPPQYIAGNGDGRDEMTGIEKEIQQAELANLKATLKNLDAEQQISEIKLLTCQLESNYRKLDLQAQHVNSFIDVAFGLLEKRQKLIDRGAPLHTVNQLLPLSLAKSAKDNDVGDTVEEGETEQAIRNRCRAMLQK